MSKPQLSIVIPALDEQDNVGPLVEQVDGSVRGAGIDAELIIVDDGSTDATPSRLAELMAKHPWLVVLRRDKAQGQSAAMYAGIQAAKAPMIATLDADLQNDPADLATMYQRVASGEADLVQGDRSGDRQDTFVRKFGSKIGRLARRWVIKDNVRDTGCSARVMRAAYAKALPMQFKGMHRFIPAYTRLLGGKIVEMPVTHRPRATGESKYGLGLLSRGPAGLMDLLAVSWMIKRHRDPSVKPMQTTAESGAES